MGLAVLSAGLPLTISNVTATIFTARMQRLLQPLGRDIVYFGNSEIPLGVGEAQEWHFAPTLGFRGLVASLSALSRPAEWLTLPVLVGLTTCRGRPQAGSDGVVQLV